MLTCRSLFAAAILVLLPFSGCIAAEKAKPVVLTTEESFALLDVLMNKMESYEKIVTDGGRERVVKVFFQIDGSTRMSLARNIAALQYVSKAAEKTRNDLIMEVSDGAGRVEPNSAQAGAFTIKWKEVLDQKVTFNLFTIKESELKLEPNPWPASTLVALLPIIEP